MKLHERYAEYFPEYQQYFGQSLRLLRSMYSMTINGKLVADDLTEWLTQEANIKQSNCQMSLYFKFVNGGRLVILSYVEDCCWWSLSKSLGKWFVEELVKHNHINILG